jgi:hypothetical protein
MTSKFVAIAASSFHDRLSLVYAPGRTVSREEVQTLYALEEIKTRGQSPDSGGRDYVLGRAAANNESTVHNERNPAREKLDRLKKRLYE